MEAVIITPTDGDRFADIHHLHRATLEVNAGVVPLLDPDLVAGAGGVHGGLDGDVTRGWYTRAVGRHVMGAVRVGRRRPTEQK